MQELIFPTHNLHKAQEIKDIVKDKIHILTLKDICLKEEIPETGTTLKENSYQKAKYIFDRFGKDCFADDTGLEVECLDGRPGVYSARFAGEHCSFDDNINLLLHLMEGKTNRKACFKTTICLIQNGEIHYFEGRCEGVITTERYGKKGFGYDPIFIPNAKSESFAEMSAKEKNAISHRALATKELINYLLKQN